jgi:hypothetical protein
MSLPSDSRIGQKLYRLLPAVYRERDNPAGDLARYLEACGLLLDGVHGLLKQRLDDAFIDTCQPWLIPYLAELLGVRLVTSSEPEQRIEIANSVAWRQRKGTVSCIRDIVQKLGQMHFEIQEGWRRVATTPRIGMPLIPLDPPKQEPSRNNPLVMARHPHLPAVTVDFRMPSQGQPVPCGVPRHPGGFDDLSKRTVDLRMPDWRRGHYHPKRLLLFPYGFFPPGQPLIKWNEVSLEDGYEIKDEESKVTLLTVSRQPKPEEGYDLWTMRGETSEPVKIRGRITLEKSDLYHFENVYLEDTVTIKSGRLELEKVAAFKVVVHGSDKEKPVLQARNSLLNEVQAARGLVRLDYCTVLAQTLAEVIQASNCLFLDEIHKDHHQPEPPDKDFIRYSRISPDQEKNLTKLLTACTTASSVLFKASFGEPGCGVLHPATSDAIYCGAEDGGELGAYHQTGLKVLAEKLKDFIPLNMEAVIIPYERIAVSASVQTRNP